MALASIEEGISLEDEQAFDQVRRLVHLLLLRHEILQQTLLLTRLLQVNECVAKFHGRRILLYTAVLAR